MGVAAVAYGSVFSLCTSSARGSSLYSTCEGMPLSDQSRVRGGGAPLRATYCFTSVATITVLLRENTSAGIEGNSNSAPLYIVTGQGSYPGSALCTSVSKLLLSGKTGMAHSNGGAATLVRTMHGHRFLVTSILLVAKGHVSSAS